MYWFKLTCVFNLCFLSSYVLHSYLSSQFLR